jgi:hypothetical protein
MGVWVAQLSVTPLAAAAAPVRLFAQSLKADPLVATEQTADESPHVPFLLLDHRASSTVDPGDGSASEDLVDTTLPTGLAVTNGRRPTMTFDYRLELASGEPADSPRLAVATSVWRPGDPIYVRPDLSYRVTEVRHARSDDEETVLVVEPD